MIIMGLLRYLFLISGLLLFGLGIAMAVEVKHLGLHPWDVLNVALYEKFGLTIGTWGVICGLLLMIVSFMADRRYIHIGTVWNALLVGPITDLFLWSGILPDASYGWTDYLILLAGMIIVGIGGGLYVAAGLGAGPRDGFMLSISDKTGLSVSRARILVESAVLVIGYVLGGPVFIATFLYTFIQSPVFHGSLTFFKKVMLSMETKSIQQKSTSL
jgi:uncharacterized membrane protein YczE